MRTACYVGADYPGDSAPGASCADALSRSALVSGLDGLSWFDSGTEAGVTTAKAAQELHCDGNTARRHLDDLFYIGLADRDKVGKTSVYSASLKFLDLAARIFLDEYKPAEALKKLSHRPTILPPEGERGRRVLENNPREAHETEGKGHEGEGA